MSGNQQPAPANLSGAILLAQQRSHVMQNMQAGHASQLHNSRALLERLRAELASLPSGSAQALALGTRIGQLSIHIDGLVRHMAALADVISELNLEGPAPLRLLQDRLQHEREVLRLTQNYLSGERSRMSAAVIADFESIINEHRRQINHWRDRITNEHPGAAS